MSGTSLEANESLDMSSPARGDALLAPTNESLDESTGPVEMETEPVAAAEQAGTGADGSMAAPQAGVEASGQPKVEDALLYLEQVKIQFREQPEVYDAFLDIMKDFKAHNIDTPGVIQRVRTLFRGHRDLIFGFNTFLPPGYKIELDDLRDEPEPPKRASSSTARPAKKGGRKKRVSNSSRARRGGMRKRDGVSAAAEPKSLDTALNYVNKIKQRFESNPEVYTVFLEILQTYQREVRTITEVYDEVSRLFANEPDLLEEFTTFLPESLAHHNRRKRGREGASRGRPLKRAKIELAPDDEIGFFNAVKRRLTAPLYADFLKALHVFSNQILSTAETVKLVRTILAGHPDLISWFEAFVDYKEQGAKMRRVQSISQIDNDEYIDYSQLKKYGPSYRALPTSYRRPSCSGRDDLCDSVLNDTWVASAATDSDDFIFKSSQKNEFEERLFLCEEERYELDMVIEQNASAIRALEPLASKILEAQKQAGTEGPGPSFKLASENALGIIQIKAIERIYGHRAKDALSGLRKNPHVAVPIILKRLRQKDRDWRRIQREWNKVWNNVNADNYRRSLDYRGAEFKTSDKKSMGTKALVSTVKEKQDQLKVQGKATAVHFTSTIESTAEIQEAYRLLLFCLTRSMATDKVVQKMRLFIVGWLAKFLGVPVETSVIDEHFAQIRKALARKHTPSGAAASAATAAAAAAAAGAPAPAAAAANGPTAGSIAEGLPPPVAAAVAEAAAKIDAAEEEVAQMRSTSTAPQPPFFGNEIYFVVLQLFALLTSRIAKVRELAVVAQGKYDAAGAQAFRKPFNKAAAMLDPTYAKRSDTALEAMDVAAAGGSVFAAVLNFVKLYQASKVSTSRFENTLNDVLGPDSYQLFTMDRILTQMTKMINSVVGDDLCARLMALYNYENGRTRNTDSSYRVSALLMMPEMTTFRLKVSQYARGSRSLLVWVIPEDSPGTMPVFSSSPASPPEASAMLAKWSEYMRTFIQPTVNPHIDVRAHNIFLPRNLVTSRSLDDPELVIQHGLAAKIDFDSYKMVYLCGTEDWLYRRGALAAAVPRFNSSPNNWWAKLHTPDPARPDPPVLDRTNIKPEYVDSDDDDVVSDSNTNASNNETKPVVTSVSVPVKAPASVPGQPPPAVPAPTGDAVPTSAVTGAVPVPPAPVAAVVLKVRVAKTGAVKSMPFNPSMSTGEVCREIRDRVGEGGSDHGLFKVGDDYSVGKWLENNKTLNYYELRSGDLVEFKKKHRPLRVQTVDGAVKTVLVDDSMIVSDMVAIIAARVGIANAEEFSLKKVDSADNEWLNPGQTLRDQGLEETDPVLLKQRFHYSDQNVDTSNPVQLNLLYEQSREAILTGKYPCTQAEAIQFASLLCQVTLHDHNPAKHKPGSLDLKNYVPGEYVKAKKIDKTILSEHRKLIGMSELNAKFRFVQLCRSLKTYGVTFFHVREQVSQGKKKKKLVDRLLGITREKIIRMDAQTKEVVKSYPLAHLKRWAASTNSFTFDFGDYEGSYYSVQTSEGEAMSQVISGYIDIILKKKKQAGRYVVDDDEEQTVVEEDISAMKAQAISRTPSNMQYTSAVNLSRAGMVQGGASGYQMSSAGAQYGTAQTPQSQNAAGGWKGQFTRGSAGELESFTTGNAAVLNASGLGGLLKDLEGAFASVNAACNELAIPVTKSPMGDSDDPMARQWRQKAMQGTRQQLRQHTDGLTVATAQVVGSAVCATPDQFDPDTLAASCKALGNHMAQLATLARTAASLVDDAESGQLMAASRQMGDATKRLVAAANGAAGGLSQSIVDPKLREEVLASAKDIGKLVNQLLAASGASEVDGAGQTKMFERTAAVAQAATKLVNDAKQVANAQSTDEARKLVNGGAKHAWTATSQLVACVKVLAPTVASAKSKQQLEKSAALVRSAVGGMIDKAGAAGVDAQDMSKLKVACQGVNQALQQLLDAARTVGDRPDFTAQYAKAAAVISAASRKLVNANGNPQEIIAGAKAVGQGSAVMIKFGKAEAGHETDPGVQKALVDATRRLADATSALMRSAKAAASNPSDGAAQDQLANDARELDIQAQDMLANSQQRLAMRNLAEATQEAISKTAALIQASKPAASANSNAAAANGLIDSARQTAEKVTGLVNALKAHQASPDNSTMQGKLVTAAKVSCPAVAGLVNASKQAAPSVTDPTAQQNLASSAKGCAMAMQKLLGALKEAKSLQGGLEFDTAMEQCNAAKEQMKSTAQRASAGTLVPEFGTTPQSSYENYMAARRAVHNNLDQLLKSSQEKDQETAAIAAKDIGSAMRGVGAAVEGVAATSDDPTLPGTVTDAGQDFADKVITALAAAKACANDPENDAKVEQLLQAVATAKGSSEAMTAALPGQREVEAAMTAVRAHCDLAQLPALQAGESQKTFQDSFLKAARALAQACQGLCRSVERGPDELAQAANGVESTTARVVAAAGGMAAATADPETKQQIVDTVGELGESIQDLLEASRGAAADPNNAESKSAINDSHLAVTDTLNELSSLFQAAGPGQKECDEAMKAIKKAAAQIEAAVVPSSMAGKSYGQIQGELKAAAKELVRGTGQLMQAAKKNPAAIPTAADTLTGAVSTITAGSSAVAQAVGDGGKVTVERFTIPQEAIKDSVNELRMANGEPKKIIGGCTGVAKSTQAIIAASKLASRQVDDPEASQQFMDLAKAIAGATAATVGAGKAVARSNTPENNAELLAQSNALQNSVAQVVALAEDHLDHSQVSPETKQLQKEILANGKEVAGNTSQLLGAAKLTAMSPQDVQCNQDMLACAKSLSDAISDLLTSIAGAAPGAQECTNAMDVAQNCISELDTAAMSASVEALDREEGQTADGCSAALATTASELSTAASKLAAAAASSPNEIGPVASSIAILLPDLTSSTVGLAACTADPVKQQATLARGKDVSEAMYGLLMTTKEVGGAADDMEGQMRIEQSSKDVSNALAALMGDVSGEMASSQQVQQAQLAAKNASSVLNGPYDTSKDYRAFNQDIVDQARTIAGAVSKLSTTAKMNPDGVGAAAENMAASLSPMMAAVNGAAQTAPDEATKNMLLDTAENLCSESAALLVRAGELSKEPTSFTKQQSVSSSAREVNMNVAKLISATKAKSSAVKGCEAAIESIQAAVHDMDTAAMFASMGQLEREDGGQFSKYRTELMTESKALAQGSAGLINTAKTSSASLAPAAEDAAGKVNAIVDAAKHAAATVFDPELQRQLFDSCRSVCNSTASLIDASRSVHDAPNDQALVSTLNASGKEFADNVSAFVAKIKEVDGENAKGVTAATTALDAIRSAVPEVTSASPPTVEPSVEAMVDASKKVAAVSAQVVSAMRSSPEALAVAATAAQDATLELLVQGKAASTDGDADAQEPTRTAVVNAANAIAGVLDVVVAAGGNSTSPAVGEELAAAARGVADAVADVVEKARELRADFVDMSDPNMVAEKSLLDAAASIEAAAQKLATLVPRPPVNMPDMDMAFEESILEAAKAIAAAVAALVKAATEAQREIVANGKAAAGGKVYHADAVWQEGLVSAAHAVAAATSEMCQAANDAAQGEGSEVSIVAASEAVSSTTAHLVAAARAKMDPNSRNQARLEDASRAVRQATSSLAESAKMYGDKMAEMESANAMMAVDSNSSAVARMRQEREARERVLRLERELEAARRAATEQNRSRYTEGSSSAAPAPAAKPKPALAAKPKPAPAAKPKPAAAAPAASSGGAAGTTYSLAELQSATLPPGVDPARKQDWLSDADFQTAFGMDRAAFAALPAWKAETLRRKAKLF
ncbi:uncharacterized protein AMSG_12193 [Thecamonas trahens ATCC 50062]|uniref:Histone deacetylase interacting domain-containing protein n=1 Tax=Thecamonas trahens ATCC 50062 TaxID=461836 RepID=A0A0L0DKH9_THETB|nr:hypothetical protein AMSG_12193 [Thecamonas trahens ATCC 50062]KNC52797.1 hypothetical protein AMSG_12193 [Thecamonas trahens ATCC 50062]|eukprot:XP_013755135.1 hypothetical protein AMSG_12193 [Thecamonas trahens ATCC 50062]